MILIFQCKKYPNSKKKNLKIVILDVLKKYVRINIDSKLISIDSFQFLSLSLDSLVKNLGKDHSKCLSQEFNKKELDLVNEKRFYS